MITFSSNEGKKAEKKRIKIGVSFNGRQSPGGHNILQGLLGNNVTVYGFIGGTEGLKK